MPCRQPTSKGRIQQWYLSNQCRRRYRADCQYAQGSNHSPLMSYTQCCQNVFPVWQVHTIKAQQQPEVESRLSGEVLPDYWAKNQVCTRAAESIRKDIAALRKTMMNETDLEVIEHVCSDGGAFKLGCACKCFPLIGSQKRFITRGEYRSATQATEKKSNSDLMSCRLEISVYAHRRSGEPLLFVLRRRDFFFF